MFAPLRYRGLIDLQSFSYRYLRAEMGNNITGKHARIIGIPIFFVNRQPDTPLFQDGRTMKTSDETLTVGERLRKAREAHKLTQEQLAVRAGVKQSSISELETGETKEISGSTLLAISDTIKISTHWLLSGRGQMDRDIATVLTERGRRLVEIFEDSSPKQKDAIFQVADAFAKPDGSASEGGN